MDYLERLLWVFDSKIDNDGLTVDSGHYEQTSQAEPEHTEFEVDSVLLANG